MNARRVAARVLAAARLDDLFAEVEFVDDAFMRELNVKWRGVDATTDVLSFAMFEGDPVVGAELSLGSIVISRDAARRQARALGHTEEEELAVLVAHGLLHLLGFDHERSAAEAMAMAELEMSVLTAADVRPELVLTGRPLL